METRIEDPRSTDVAALLQGHLDFCHSVTPPERVFALDVEKLRRLGVTLFGARESGELVGVAALKLLSPTHAELKSMHVISNHRGAGIGDRLIAHLVEFGRNSGIERISLETSPDPAFLPARRLYSKHGFAECGAFADYSAGPTSVFMSLVI